ncbi:PTS system ascorbate-specific IIB component [Sporomusaceae bacterium BoRhaA]|jgi:ascorbate PTS system EIIB component|uniref:PTS sugar transporter subunit IIB n=1 Tax=Pelorhabdus rhamnosifermentans TaxID=2772457 RepID=UPI001C05FAC9|nr:PTS sugar transporter subunit IIB [Pelorhabdus rhamnosifermentans]MBU2700880.1 PTS system ascorbate-specific IIB component [Pelorhabdus rhamnosifermentans]
MLKVVAACGNGMGSSQIIKMKIDKIFKKLNMPVEIHHMSVGEAKAAASGYDVVFCSIAFVDIFSVKNNRTKVIGLKNLLSETEIETKIRENLTVSDEGRD